MTVSDAQFRLAAIRTLSPLLLKAVEDEATKCAGEDLASQPDVTVSIPRARQVREVFAAWVVATGKNAGTKLDSNRENLIAKSIKSHGLETTLDAVRGVALSDYHMGRDPKTNGTKYNGLDLVLRNAEKIEHFAGLSAMERRNAQVTSEPDPTSERLALVQEFIDAVHSTPGGWRSLEHHQCRGIGGLKVEYAVKVNGIWLYAFGDDTLDHVSIMYSAALYVEASPHSLDRQMVDASLTSAFEDLKRAYAHSVRLGRSAA